MLFWLNQWKSCVSVVHTDGGRAVTPLSSRPPVSDIKGTAALGHSGTVRDGGEKGIQPALSLSVVPS